MGRKRPMVHEQRIAVSVESRQSGLTIEPNVFHAPAIELAVDHDGHSLELGCIQVTKRVW
jgi:hypothetical protein